MFFLVIINTNLFAQEVVVVKDSGFGDIDLVIKDSGFGDITQSKSMSFFFLVSANCHQIKQ